jgi:4-hydroxy-3-methylbut-2-enyl diphosphate reductase
MALAWAAVAALMPRIETGLQVPPGSVVAFLFCFSMVFVRSALSDILDIQSDRLIGRETIPVLIGKGRTQQLLHGIAAATLVLMAAAPLWGWTSGLSWALIPSLFYVWICFPLYDRKAQFSALFLEGLLETSYIVAGLCVLLWIVLTRWGVRIF